MIVKIDSKNDRNGNRYQVVIDNDKKTVSAGYSLFLNGDVKLNSKTEVKALKQAFLNAGYQDINE